MKRYLARMKQLIVWMCMVGFCLLFWTVLLRLCLSTARADGIPSIRWEIETSRVTQQALQLVRGETVYLEPQYLSYGEPLTLTNVVAVVLRYRDSSLAEGLYYAATGSVLSASEGRIRVVWTPAQEAAATSYGYTIAATTTNGNSLRGLGLIKLVGSVSGTTTNPLRALTSIDWAAVENSNLASAPFGLGGSGDTNGLAVNGLNDVAESNRLNVVSNNLVAATNGLRSWATGTFQPVGAYLTDELYTLDTATRRGGSTTNTIVLDGGDEGVPSMVIETGSLGSFAPSHPVEFWWRDVSSKLRLQVNAKAGKFCVNTNQSGAIWWPIATERWASEAIAAATIEATRITNIHEFVFNDDGGRIYEDNQQLYMTGGNTNCQNGGITVSGGGVMIWPGTNQGGVVEIVDQAYNPALKMTTAGKWDFAGREIVNASIPSINNEQTYRELADKTLAADILANAMADEIRAGILSTPLTSADSYSFNRTVAGENPIGMVTTNGVSWSLNPDGILLSADVDLARNQLFHFPLNESNLVAKVTNVTGWVNGMLYRQSTSNNTAPRSVAGKIGAALEIPNLVTGNPADGTNYFLSMSEVSTVGPETGQANNGIDDFIKNRKGLSWSYWFRLLDGQQTAICSFDGMDDFGGNGTYVIGNRLTTGGTGTWSCVWYEYNGNSMSHTDTSYAGWPWTGMGIFADGTSTWHHLTTVLDITEGRTYSYLDGQTNGNWPLDRAIATTIYPIISKVFALGGSPAASAYRGVGAQFDDFRLWTNRVISLSEAAAMWSAPTEAELITVGVTPIITGSNVVLTTPATAISAWAFTEGIAAGDLTNWTLQASLDGSNTWTRVPMQDKGLLSGRTRSWYGFTNGLAAGTNRMWRIVVTNDVQNFVFRSVGVGVQ
jgi:hypothetical protein